MAFTLSGLSPFFKGVDMSGSEVMSNFSISSLDLFEGVDYMLALYLAPRNCLLCADTYRRTLLHPPTPYTC